MVNRARQLYVEGGGDNNPSLASECRKAFAKLFEKAGVRSKPRVIACGGRAIAYRQFCKALESGDADVWLLVDAEEIPKPVSAESPWAHVKARIGDHWERPAGATDDQLQLMVVCMEAWLAADVEAMKSVFGPKFDESKVPTVDRLEQTEKSALYAAIHAATRSTAAGPYGKGAHSFKVLARVAPPTLRKLAWAKRFLDEMGATK